MEVFTHNLPIDLSEDGFKDQLKPFMAALAVSDYTCDKPRKKRFGRITFLNHFDGQRFLASHGEVYPAGHTRPKSNLHLLGSDVYCKLSNKQPQDYALKALAHAADERHKPTHVVEDEGNSVSFILERSSCGYTTFTNDEFIYVPEVQWADSGSVTFKKRNIIVKLDNMHLIRIPINTVIEMVWTSSGSIIITLTNVPLFFYNNPGGQSLILDVKFGNLVSRSSLTRSRLCSLGSTHSDFVGQCLVYQFQVRNSNIVRKMEQLKECALTITPYPFQSVYVGNFHTQLSTLKTELGDHTRDGTIPFGVLFQLQALVQNAYLPPSTVRGLTKKLASVSKARKLAGRNPISINSLKKLFSLIDWPSPIGDPEEFDVDALLGVVMESEQYLCDGVIQADGFLSRPTQHLALIHRIMVTPSRITLHGPELEPLNRILRRFPNHHEYFVRAQFCDENGQDIHFSPQVNNDEVFARFKSVLKNGFQIAGRTYTFLGFSHSSLRSHSAWFSAPFVDDNEGLQTYFSIIKAIGTFSSITSPAKCAARIGQAFSETPFAVKLRENDISVWKIPDVESEDHSRVFSDGVGTISWGAMEAIRKILPAKKGLPTCFQIRMGGAKGMLALNSQLEESRIHIRPSMIKFESTDLRDVEICDVASKPIPLVLNRQVIKIMEDMGVPGNWFSKLQALRVDQLRMATATTKSTARFLRGQDVAECVKLYRLFLLFNRLNLNYKEDPFLRSVVEAMVLRELRLLKHKARIPVENGITLFGIMDETGFLEENEVYVTYDTMHDRFNPPPLDCRLLVTRSPALHDGDIQYVSNRRPPKDHPLNSLKNCIIFNKKGKRDLPSQLSGGDLDGDLYNIIWDPEAMPTRVFDPADYPRVDPVDIGRAVTKDDMAEFFIDFMQSDRLGVIATKHMILADQMEFGTSHSDCKKLAQLHSTAVDFSKTGIPVKLEEMPSMSRYRPDFLAPGPQAYVHDKQVIKLEPYYIRPNPNDDEDSGPVHSYYRSEKILGKLYRAIDEHKIWSEEIRTTTQPNPTAFWKKLIGSLTARCITLGAPITWQHHVETARQLRSAYEDAIYAAMTNFSEHPINPITELEVFIGHIMNKSGVQTHRQRERSIKLKDEFERIASWILSQMRPQGPLSGYTTEFDSVERCLACAHIAGEVDSRRSEHRRGRWNGLQSFRVVAACALLMEVESLEKNVTVNNETVAVTVEEPGVRDRSYVGHGGDEEKSPFSLGTLLRALGQ
ncbi:RNA dependent RNA polymerase-domain-containing protein [Aspergillus cavernicola]|uniref:RNA-dependent RNA polymerase n=1 Tax=Aspergillus cavernicola TaxID=176166 RepID=A0ABR4I6D8_9EURO